MFIRITAIITLFIALFFYMAVNSDRAWHHLGNAYYDRNRYDKAIHVYHKAVRINPEHAGTWYNLGNAYHELKHHNEAITAYREAVRIDPELTGAWYSLGIIYDTLGRHAEADNANQQFRRLEILHDKADKTRQKFSRFKTETLQDN